MNKRKKNIVRSGRMLWDTDFSVIDRELIGTDEISKKNISPYHSVFGKIDLKIFRFLN